MKFSRLIALLIVAGVAAVIGYYGYRFFFDPAGINVAGGEFCIVNGSGVDLVFSGTTEPGANVIQLLTAGEGMCVPAPDGSSTGSVTVGMAEGEETCSFEAPNISVVARLEAFDAGGACKWGE